MPTPSKYTGIPGDQCQCGRRATIRHCTLCGSARVYARSSRLHKMLNGTQKYVEVQFRCQACGHLFIDEEREFCEAPPLTQAQAQQKLKAVREAEKTGEYLNPADKLLANALTEILGKPNRSLEEKENDRKILITKLRGAYADMVLAEAEKLGISFQEAKDRGVITESMDDFVNRNLAALEASNIEARIPEQEPDEDESAKRRGYQLDWTQYSFTHGGRFPASTFEEYVQRRLAGEVF